MIMMPLLVLILALLIQSLGCGENMIKTAFFLMIVSTGIIGGMQFPLVNTLYLTHHQNCSQFLGLVYAFDLFGSSVGAFLISAIVIPLFGIPHTLLYLTFINALCLCALCSAKPTTIINTS